MVEKHEIEYLVGPDESPFKTHHKRVSKRPVYRPLEELTKKELDSYCTKCNNIKSSCHDVVIGPFCRNSFVHYYHEESKKRVNLLVAKKMFFTSYDNFCKMKDYEATKKLGIPKTKHNPPGCVMKDSFGFCVDWFNYMKNDGFVNKKVDKSKPYAFGINDFKKTCL